MPKIAQNMLKHVFLGYAEKEWSWVLRYKGEHFENGIVSFNGETKATFLPLAFGQLL